MQSLGDQMSKWKRIFYYKNCKYRGKIMRIKIIILSLSVYSIFNLKPTFSEEVSIPEERTEAILEEIRWLQAESIITIATRHEIPIRRAPGIATVITAKQIKQMGFRTLVDVLKTVPGYDISMEQNGSREIAVRGWLGDTSSEKVKVLIDGHSVNDARFGSATWNFHDLVVENIKRVEVIRGPGSALYGQNAFLGVVNIVTKDTDDIDGFQWTTSAGNYDTQNYNMLFGKEYGDLKISGFFDFFDTEGFSEKVERTFSSQRLFLRAPEGLKMKRTRQT